MPNIIINRRVLVSPPRSGGGDPVLPVTANLIARWEADFITGLNDGDPVTTWVDQSPSGRDATQSTVANKPAYKTNIYGTKPAVRFDAFTNADLLNFTQPTFAGGFTVFAAWNMTAQASSFSFGPLRVRGAAGAGFSLVGDGVSTSNPIKHLVIWNGAGAEIFNVKGPDESLSLPGTPRGKVVDTWRWDGATTITMRKNGSAQSVTNSAVTGYGSGGNANIGAPYNAVSSDTAAILIYDASLSDSDVILVENYLNTKYPSF